MPIRPEATSTGKPSAPTAGPTIQLANGESMELSWQERALCAQTDPEAYPVISKPGVLSVSKVKSLGADHGIVLSRVTSRDMTL